VRILAAGIIVGIGDVSIKITSSFTLSGIALGTIITILAYHMLRLVAPPHLREEPQVAGRVYERGTGRGRRRRQDSAGRDFSVH